MFNDLLVLSNNSFIVTVDCMQTAYFIVYHCYTIMWILIIIFYAFCEVIFMLILSHFLRNTVQL